MSTCNVEPKGGGGEKTKKPFTHKPEEMQAEATPLTLKFTVVKHTFCATESRNFVQWETKDVRNKQNLCCPRPHSSDASWQPVTLGWASPGQGAAPVRDALDFLPARKSSPCFRRSKGATTTHKQTSLPPAARLKPVLGELWSHFISMRKSAILADVRVLDFAPTNQGKKVIAGRQLSPSLICYLPKKISNTASYSFQQTAMQFSTPGYLHLGRNSLGFCCC